MEYKPNLSPKVGESPNHFRLDQITGNVFILAGEEIEIEIKPNGEWTK